MKPPETLETERLRLRRPSAEDAEWLFDGYATDPEVTKWLAWPAHESIEVTRAFLQRCRTCWEDGSAFPWVLELRADGRPVGMIELRIDVPKADVGYVLERASWGKGYMPEAVVALRDWALARKEIYRFWAVCDVANRGSARVLEKAGLELEGTLRYWGTHAGQPRDCLCYAAVKPEGS